MRVLVCGGREFTNTKLLYKIMDDLHKNFLIDSVIEGNARGADRMAGAWARANKIDNLKFRPDWNKYGMAAGPIRNQQMLDEGKPDLVVAFPGKNGTADMVARAKKAGVKVIEVKE